MVLSESLPQGIVSDGKSLWVSGQTNSYLYNFDLDGNLLQFLDFLGFLDSPNGMAFDGAFLWVVNADTDSISQVSIS